ncbi:hypothetical protein QQ045_028134 [Rhodiola kirilowii]
MESHLSRLRRRNTKLRLREKGVNEVLTSPLRRVGYTMFRQFGWSAEYNPKKESTSVTKWIRFPGLPMEMFDRAIIKSIVASFALFLDCDDKTKEMDSLNYARACVELDVTKTVPSSVWINLPGNNDFFQDIVVEGGLKYCASCKLHGHDMTNCRRMQKSGERKEKMMNAMQHNDGAKEQIDDSFLNPSPAQDIAELIDEVDSLTEKLQVDEIVIHDVENKNTSENSISHVAETMDMEQGYAQKSRKEDKIFYSKTLGGLVHISMIPHFNKITNGVYQAALEEELNQDGEDYPSNISQ